MKRRISFFAAVLLITVLCMAAVPAAAYTVTVDGQRTAYAATLPREGALFVPLRAASASLLRGADISWSGATATATVKTASLTVTAHPGDSYIIANGRCFYTEQPVFAWNGAVYAPLRALCRAADASVSWNGATATAAVRSGSGACQPGSSYYNANDLYWLSRIISAESRGEPLRGQIAVGNVVQNRVRSSQFPDTVYDVIFDRQFGVQFTPTANGAIDKAPTEKAVLAAKICLEGTSLSTRALYFLDPAIATSNWIVRNRTYLFTIGNHDFYD